MNTSNYDQLELTAEQVGDAINYLTENLMTDMLLFQGRPIGISLPNFVNLKVRQADPGSKATRRPGARSRSPWRPGTSQGPLFIEEGEVLKIDTRTGTYVERVK